MLTQSLYNYSGLCKIQLKLKFRTHAKLHKHYEVMLEMQKTPKRKWKFMTVLTLSHIHNFISGGHTEQLWYDVLRYHWVSSCRKQLFGTVNERLTCVFIWSGLCSAGSVSSHALDVSWLYIPKAFLIKFGEDSTRRLLPTILQSTYPDFARLLIVRRFN